jgi:hypothetical protein
MGNVVNIRKPVEWEYMPPHPDAGSKPENGNHVAQGKGFYVSYCADTSDNEVAKLVEDLGIKEGSTKEDGAETALCMGGERSHFLILKGDWRKEYEPLIPRGYDACVEFWKSKQAEHRSRWSNDPIITSVPSVK